MAWFKIEFGFGCFSDSLVPMIRSYRRSVKSPTAHGMGTMAVEKLITISPKRRRNNIESGLLFLTSVPWIVFLLLSSYFFFLSLSLSSPFLDDYKENVAAPRAKESFPKSKRVGLRGLTKGANWRTVINTTMMDLSPSSPLTINVSWPLSRSTAWTEIYGGNPYLPDAYECN